MDEFGSEDEEDRGRRRAQLGLREAAGGTQEGGPEDDDDDDDAQGEVGIHVHVIWDGSPRLCYLLSVVTSCSV